MFRMIHALLLRATAGFALGFALFLWVLPLSLYAEGIWVQGLEDLICFLLISGLLSTPLVIAASSSWRRSAELWSTKEKGPSQRLGPSLS